jgi:demethylmenaquinone methyltransferase/2-methoxy-6-polyprenyl-1,4-benzoquinol methylase
MGSLRANENALAPDERRPFIITCNGKKVKTISPLEVGMNFRMLPHHPISPSLVQKRYVRTLFDGIAHRYDLLNHVLSAGLDIFWRRRAIATLDDIHPRAVLDVATGTGDFAIAALRANPASVVGVDISQNMLAKGREKIARKGLENRISLQTGDAEHLDFPADSFDAVTVAFGVRNFEHLEQGLLGMHRVLRPGGKIVVLEFSRPQTAPFRQMYFFYFRHILPRIGRAVSDHDEAYTYLPDTVMRFPEGAEFLGILQKVGFSRTTENRLTGGIVTIYTGIK